jgi:hypothetical protein
VHHEFVPPDQSVTGHFYVHVFLSLRDSVRRKRLDKWQAGTVHHDNAPSHISLFVLQFLSSPSHGTIWISLRVTFGCSLL